MTNAVASYSRYIAQKGWTAERMFTVEDDTYFRKELQEFRVSGARVIEIGFGAGHCLAWLTACGAKASGIEIQRELVEVGRERGYDTFLPDDFDWTAARGQIDLILGFDVVEHLSDEERITLLRLAAEALRPSGAMVLRFPNGASPFGLHYLVADPTHRTPVSGSRLWHLLVEHEIADLTLETWRDQRLSPPRGAVRRARRGLSAALRVATDFVLHHGYLRGERIPLAANSIVVLRKAASERA